MPESTQPRILLVRFSAMGDIILTTPLLRAIKARYPRAHLTFVTRSRFAPLLESNPRVDEVVAWSDDSWGELVRELRGRRFTHRLDLHGSWRSGRLRRAVGGRWGRYPKHRVVRALLIKIGRDFYRDRRHVAERYFDAAKRLQVVPDGGSAEFFLPRGAVAQADAFLEAHGLGRSRTLLALAPGAAHATKRWPERHWAALVEQLAERADLVVVGGEGERELGERLAAVAGGHAASAAGLVALPVSGALIKRSRALAAGDTGLMHLATAVGVPVVTLLGPTVSAFGFTPYRSRATILERTDLKCRPCSAHGGPRCPLGHHRCLEEILPEDVMAALQRLPG